MRKQYGIVRWMVRVKSTGSHTPWKWESQTEWSDAWSESNQQVYILPGNEKANGMIRCMIRAKPTSSHTLYKMHGKSQINNFTYYLEVRKQDRMVRCMFKVKTTTSHTPWKWESKWNGQMHDQSQMNKFTYSLQMRKQMEWSDTWSESNQQVHIHTGNEKANRMVR